MSDSRSYRTQYTPEQRAATFLPYIDPGMVNHRRLQTFLGSTHMAVVDHLIGNLPARIPGWQSEVRIDHIYTQVALHVCNQMNVPPLAVVALQPQPQTGTVVCSTERIAGSRRVFNRNERVTLKWQPEIALRKEVVFELSAANIRADTLRSWLSRISTVSFIAILDEVTRRRLVFAPLVIGAPWLNPPPEGAAFDPTWLHWEFYEHFVEDIDEFRQIRTTPDRVNWNTMRRVSEHAFKVCLCEILGDTAAKDWAGERSDHFTSHIHLSGRRLSAAFLLKGPGGGFKPMQTTHLGKHGDQLYRLAMEPAEMLIVQHCHEISSAVRATLRAFAVQPSQARRYCLIDGRDSFRLLKAYDMVEKALAFSRRK